MKVKRVITKRVRKEETGLFHWQLQ